jgi:hypothetical protein
VSDPDGVALELGGGFSDDEVVVVVDGRQVWRGTGVTTNWSVGLADVIHLPASARTVEVRVGRSSSSMPLPCPPDGDGEVRLRADRCENGRLRLDFAPAGPVF